ncbi:MAG: hypothetical protein QNJ36_05960 [Calothrix sp. MO_167.B42]|nr:hypothetical protein [Calothrix sp. MO_167.B42]
MRLFLRLLGLGFIIGGIYILGQNIIFTTNPYPYWWRGISADGSIISLMSGIMILIFAPRSMKRLGFISVAVAIALIFVSSKAILNPTSLWQFFLSFTMIAGGYQTLTTGRSPF